VPIDYDSTNDLLWVYNNRWLPLGTTRVKSVNTSTTIDNTADTWLVQAPIANVTMTLPSAATYPGRRFTVKKTGGASKVILATTSSQTIDGLATYPFAEVNQSVTVQSDGSNWQIVHQAGLVLENVSSNWCGPEFAMPLTSYVGAAQPLSANTELFACSADSTYSMLVTQYDINYFVGGTNNGSNYWVVELRKLSTPSGILSMTTPNTSLGAANTWVHPSPTTSFSNNPLVTTDVWMEVYVSKVGTPAGLNCAVKVMGRKIYT
jgi:hypothetical protein